MTNWTFKDPTSRCRFAIAGILAVGWSIAIAVYVRAAPAVDDDGLYQYDLGHSKKYLRQLEQVGGKAALWGNDFNEWFARLWRGRSLAYTIACLTVLVAVGYCLWCRPSSTGSQGDQDQPTR